jgi:3'(2'), 5'-bisphosphate nucleotidase
MLLRTGDTSAMLAEIIIIAQQAGEAVRRIELRGDCAIQYKSDASTLTEADLIADRLISEGLRALDPQTLVISEEGRWTIQTGAPERFWLVDPLDGTREFVAGNGEYSVNIGLIEAGEPVLGVVHVPARGITYAASRGNGAVRIENGSVEAIHARSDGELVVVSSRSHGGSSLRAFLSALPPHRNIALGSALKMCLVADGTAHIYPRLGPTCWWDTAAAHAIACECGARLTALDGTPLRYTGSDVCNPSFVCSSVPHDVWQHAAEAVLSRPR